MNEPSPQDVLDQHREASKRLMVAILTSGNGDMLKDFVVLLDTMKAYTAMQVGALEAVISALAAGEET